jgi:DNA-binding PadR family transcriptional regulator
MIWRKKDNNTSAPNLPSLSRKEALILEMLVSGGRELYGLEMVEESKGELKRGTIYVTLQRMQEKDLIDSRQESRPAPEIGIPRRLYRITGHGARVFAAYQAALSSLKTALASAGV